MAQKVNAGKDWSRSDLFHVDPNQIVVQEDLRGRKFPPTPEQIQERAIDIFRNTQLQPILCRKMKIGNQEDRLKSTLGFTRVAACRLIRQGFTFTNEAGEEETIHDPDWKIKVILTVCNDEESFRKNIAENLERNATSDIDDAHNQQILRDRYGMSDVDIAKVYHQKDSVKVGRLKKLLLLDAATQELVHYGRLSTAAALDALEIEDEVKRKEIISQATKDNGKVHGATIREAVREQILTSLADAIPTTDDDAPVESSGVTSSALAVTDGKGPKKITRSIKEIKKFFDQRHGKVLEVEVTPSVKEFCRTMRRWLDGNLTDKSLHAALVKLQAASADEAVETIEAVDSVSPKKKKK